MSARILVVNAGSSSLKLRLLDGDRRARRERRPRRRGRPRRGPRGARRLGPADAVGHRVVHGGRAYTEPVLVDDRVMADLRQLVDLAPLHQPAALDALDLVRRCRPELPAVACFDTAFHAGLPAAAATYALPRRGAIPSASGGTASTACRTPPRHGAPPTCWTARHRPAARHLPPRRRCLPRRRAGRSVGGHDHGVHALDGLVMATRSGRRPRADPLARAARGRAGRRAGARAGARLGPARSRGHGRHARGRERGRRPAMRMRRSRSPSTCTGSGR